MDTVILYSMDRGEILYKHWGVPLQIGAFDGYFRHLSKDNRTIKH